MYNIQGLASWIEANILGQRSWNRDRITDEWFRAHFDYAAGVLSSWLSGYIDMPSSRILNFGCGDGISDLSLVLEHGVRCIHGIDIRREYRKLPKIAREQIGLYKLPHELTFQTIEPGASLKNQHKGYDAIISWSTFEHVNRAQLTSIISDLHDCLKPGGIFFLQIEPLYYSPFGSHLKRYISEPWHHLLNTNEQLWASISMHADALDDAEVDFGFDDFGPENYKKFVFNEYKNLNKLTADELINIFSKADFRLIRQERRYFDIEVPDSLLPSYDENVLLNNEIMLLLQRN